jgi:hypothetical protein
MVDGTSEVLKIKDKNGNEHQLLPISLKDFLEYEKMTGGSLISGKDEPKLRDIACLLYLSLRREGLSPEDIRNRRFKMNEDDVYELFDLSFLENAATILSDLLKVSGFKRGEQKDQKPKNA